MQPDEVRRLADEVAALMASRLGGARRGTSPDLAAMLRRRGAALPRRLRAQAVHLAEVDRLAASPRIARQIDLKAATRGHAALVKHLRPLGALSRWQDRFGGFAAAVALGLVVLGIAVIWVLVWRGYV